MLNKEEIATNKKQWLLWQLNEEQLCLWWKKYQGCLFQFVRDILRPDYNRFHQQIEKKKPTYVDDVNGPVICRPCKTPLQPPSSFQWREAAEHSQCFPDADLELVHVYGYAGIRNTSPNLFVNNEGKLVYYTAGVAIVASPQIPQRFPEKGKEKLFVKAFQESSVNQQFYLEHSDDMLCITLHPNGILAASGEQGLQPRALIWDTCTLLTKTQLKHPEGSRGIVCVSFSDGDGQYLVTVATDNAHTVRVYDWARQRCLYKYGGYKGTPPQVFGVKWDPFQPITKSITEGVFVTYGINHIKQWKPIQEEGKELYFKSTACTWNGKGPLDVLCVEFLPIVLTKYFPVDDSQKIINYAEEKSFMITGHLNSLIVIWRRFVAVSVLQPVDFDVEIPMSTQLRKPLYGNPMDLVELEDGIRCIKLWNTGKAQQSTTREWTLGLSTGDGLLKLYHFTNTKSPSNQYTQSTIQIPCQDTSSLRAFEMALDGQHIFIGSRSCDIWQVDLTENYGVQKPIFHNSIDKNIDNYNDYNALHNSCSQIGQIYRLVCGQSGDSYAVVVHPQKSEVFAVGCDCSSVCIYNAQLKRCIGNAIQTFGNVRAIAFSNPCGEFLAVGMSNGFIQVFDNKRQLTFSFAQAGGYEVCEIKYSGDGNVLAVGSKNLQINLYCVTKGRTFIHYAKCVGHSGSVNHIDFSMDGLIMRSNSSDYEIMFWDVQTGKQLNSNCPEQRWATATCKLGFDVMGVWTNQKDGTDINSLSVDPSQKFVVIADDFGKVSLMNYPCIVWNCGRRVYGGHSSHVMMVRFCCQGRRVFSVGGRDRATFQWKVTSPTVKYRNLQADDALLQGQSRYLVGGGGPNHIDMISKDLSLSRSNLHKFSYLKNINSQQTNMQTDQSTNLVKRTDDKIWNQLDKHGKVFGWVKKHTHNNKIQTNMIDNLQQT